MLRFRASLTVAVLVAASLMLSVPASAGGPTSALLSVPGEGKTASREASPTPSLSSSATSSAADAGWCHTTGLSQVIPLSPETWVAIQGAPSPFR